MAAYGKGAGPVAGSLNSTKNSLLVAAIDFGTTYSGWAFSFKHEYDSDPTKVSSKTWIGGQNVSLKAPTTVLIRPDGRTLEAFGYDAENRYAELALESQHEEYYYFRRFKMMLHDKVGLSRDITLEDDKGLILPAERVFSLAIRYLKDDLLETCSTRLAGGSVDESDVHWVLTVPAIWNDAAKQFMRESAIMAGIQSEQLSIALEPEAASLFCRHLPVEKMIGAEGQGTISAFKEGAKYMVVDAGGGTVDITVHEVMSGGRLKELNKASGGAWGGTCVDEAFRQMLIKIFGLPVLRSFQRRYMDDYLDLFREFEVKKRDICPDKDNKVTQRLPHGLKEIFTDETEEDLRETIAQTHFSENMTLSAGDKLRTNACVYKNLFKEALDSIVSHVKELLKDPINKQIDAILMVGGFSESPMLQQAMKEKFPRYRVIVPEEAGLVVLKGAVLFGHSPASITERVCKHTYGIEMNTEFVEGQHDSHRKFEQNGKTYCREIFDKHVTVGQTVKYGEPQAQRSYQPLTDSQSHVDFIVYASSSKYPSYVTDPGCQCLGKATVQVKDMTVPLYQRSLVVTLTFSGTEIEVKAKEKCTGLVTNASVDFLG